MSSERSTAFTSSQYAYAYPPGVERHYWHLARNALLAPLVRGLDPGLTLEVGCGVGCVVAALRAAGVDCWGVDLGEVEPLAQVERFVFGGSDARALPRDFRGGVRTMLLLDVIEHVDAPERLLRQLHEHFAGCRYLVLTVPARAELWSSYDEHYQHRRRYDLAALERTVASALPAARLIDSRYFFRAFYAPALFAARIGGRREVRVRAPAGVHGLLLHRAIANGSRWLDRLLPRWIPGSSALCVAALGR